MNRHLLDALTGTLSSHLDLGKSRLETLALLVLGLINGRTVNLSHIASQISGTASIPSSYRRLQRFFQHVRLDRDWQAAIVIKWLGIRPPWIVCLDRTNWKIGRRDVNILTLAVVTPPPFPPPLPSLLPFPPPLPPHPSSLENNIIFSIRLKESAVVRLQDGHTYHLGSLFRTRRKAKQILAQPGRFDTMTDRFGWPLTFIAKRLPDGERLILATNGPATAALNIYTKRWQIECLFGDSKTRGLNIEDTRITDTDKLSSLLVLVTLAMAWAHVTAIAAQAGAAIKRRAHGYRYKSWFRTGFDHLRNWIIFQPDKAAHTWTKTWPKRRVKTKTLRVV